MSNLFSSINVMKCKQELAVAKAKQCSMQQFCQNAKQCDSIRLVAAQVTGPLAQHGNIRLLQFLIQNVVQSSSLVKYIHYLYGIFSYLIEEQCRKTGNKQR